MISRMVSTVTPMAVRLKSAAEDSSVVDGESVVVNQKLASDGVVNHELVSDGECNQVEVEDNEIIR